MYCGKFKGVTPSSGTKSWYWLRGSHGKSAVGYMFGSMWCRSDLFADPANATTSEINMFNMMNPGVLEELNIVLVGGEWVLDRKDDTLPRPINLSGGYLHGGV